MNYEQLFKEFDEKVPGFSMNEYSDPSVLRPIMCIREDVKSFIQNETLPKEEVRKEIEKIVSAMPSHDAVQRQLDETLQALGLEEKV